MMYVGRKSEDTAVNDEIRIPSQYSGNAFDSDGVRRGYDFDGEALRRAEEAFRRGYVFEDQAPEPDPEPQVQETVAEHEAEPTGADTEAVHTSGNEAEKSVPASGKVQSESRPIISAIRSLFGSISTEDIIIIALILMLLSSGADDELLIMLAILLFC